MLVTDDLVLSVSVKSRTQEKANVMLPIVLTACILSPESRAYPCIDNMYSFRTKQSSSEETRSSVLSTLFDAFAGSTADEREKAQVMREAEQLKKFEERLQTLKKKNDPAEKELRTKLEKLVKDMKSYQHWR